MGGNHSLEISGGKRFDFGSNWAHFLEVLDEECIEQAEKSLQKTLGVTDLNGKSFLDVGSGSGLFSLAARRLGARVHSFDYDPTSVACTRELKQRNFPDDTQWRVEEGSVLDRDYLIQLGGIASHRGNVGSAWQCSILGIKARAVVHRYL